MIWAGISANDKTPLVFMPKNVNINTTVYQEQVFKKYVFPFKRSHPQMIFQQDWAPAHSAISTLRGGISALLRSSEVALNRKNGPETKNYPELSTLTISSSAHPGKSERHN
ncbi:unnamed protein product [Cylicocyclus nassatus]|uniref:Uncharacterized protein n=1 Tax=Cylicocyclus nassatus TaxID=53992 RepID=A0AA36DT44_CYLNA|nr:unnamed protein product [Cylicocyclus nassatus]